MNIKPLANRIVVKPAEAADMTAGGIYIPESAKEKSLVGVVVAVGPGEVINGTKVPMETKVDDIVLYTSLADNKIEIDGVNHLIMRESDVYAIRN